MKTFKVFTFGVWFGMIVASLCLMAGTAQAATPTCEPYASVHSVGSPTSGNHGYWDDWLNPTTFTLWEHESWMGGDFWAELRIEYVGGGAEAWRPPTAGVPYGNGALIERVIITKGCNTWVSTTTTTTTSTTPGTTTSTLPTPTTGLPTTTSTPSSLVTTTTSPGSTSTSTPTTTSPNTSSPTTPTTPPTSSSPSPTSSSPSTTVTFELPATGPTSPMTNMILLGLFLMILGFAAIYMGRRH